ncbi:MAG: hypothetical protein AMXMBFR8_29780 [Nevskiales bacterium]
MPLLFSYGTLQRADAQLATLGRIAKASADVLEGYTLSTVQVTDAALIASSGITVHANVLFDGRVESRVSGVVLEVTEAELLLCDRYEEPARYERVLARLASGREAWVYAYCDRPGR